MPSVLSVLYKLLPPKLLLLQLLPKLLLRQLPVESRRRFILMFLLADFCLKHKQNQGLQKIH
jgi:hypothetical protein